MNSGRDEAGKLGSCVHDLVSEMLGGEKADYPTELRDKCTPNAVRVVAEIIGRKWMVLNTELAMDAPSYPFVGTTDLVVRDESGATGIADVKTGYVGEEVPIQLAAYAALYENERPADVAPVTWGAAIQCKFGEPINVTIYNHEQIIAAGAIFMALLSIDGLRAKLKAIA